MARKKTKKADPSVIDNNQPTKMGRPPIEFTEEMWERIYLLCKAQCTEEEIAADLDISADTLSRRIKERFNITFAEFFAVKRKAGLGSLRSRQYEVAMAGDVQMLKHLGRHLLDQNDKLIIDTGDVKDGSAERNAKEMTPEERKAHYQAMLKNVKLRVNISGTAEPQPKEQKKPYARTPKPAQPQA